MACRRFSWDTYCTRNTRWEKTQYVIQKSALRNASQKYVTYGVDKIRNTCIDVKIRNTWDYFSILKRCDGGKIRAVGKKDAIRDVRKVRNTWRGPKIRNTRGYKIRNTCSRPKIRYTCRMRKYAIRNEGIKWLIQAQAQNIQAQAQNTQYGTREKKRNTWRGQRYAIRAPGQKYALRAAGQEYAIREAAKKFRNTCCYRQIQNTWGNYYSTQ